MSHDVAPALVSALLEHFPAQRSYPPSAFEKPPMPGPVAHFLQHQLRDQLKEQNGRLALKNLTWTDHNHPDIRQAHRTLRERIEDHAQIPAELWEKELTQAAHRTMHYLIRPVPTAIRFIYVEEEPSSLPANQVLNRLAYFAAYPYLREAARAYITQRNLEKVDRTRLATLLTRVDQQMTEDYSPDQWEKLLSPLFEMARLAFDQPAIPAHELEQFFNDKDQSEAVSRLRTRSGLVDREELRALFRVDQEPAPAPTAERGTEPKSPATSEPLKHEAPTSSSDDDSDDDAVPLWKQFQQRNAPTTATTVANNNSDNNSDDEEEERPRWAGFQPEPRESPATAPLEKLEREVFGGNGLSNRKRYIRELFNGSEEDYRDVLGTLRDTDNWNEASQIIARDVFRKHQVNIYSDPAVSFTNAVEAGYE